VSQPPERFVEEVGLAAESDGLPRIAGRLFGYLLLSAEPRSLDEIADALGVSKASVSLDARLLLRHGWLQRVSRTGDRRDYYEMAPDFFARIVAYRLGRWTALHDLIATARPNLGKQPGTVEQRLQYLDEAQEFFVNGMQRLLDDWGRKQKRASGAKRTQRRPAA
jgi:DNA-binding transcriptional regulator GbsR (MarR family)